MYILHSVQILQYSSPEPQLEYYYCITFYVLLRRNSVHSFVAIPFHMRFNCDYAQCAKFPLDAVDEEAGCFPSGGAPAPADGCAALEVAGGAAIIIMG